MTVLPFYQRGRLSPAAQRLKRTAERRAPGTEEAYDRDWRHWTAWLAARGLAPEDAGDLELASHLAELCEGGARSRRSGGARPGLRASRSSPASRRSPVRKVPR